MSSSTSKADTSASSASRMVDNEDDDTSMLVVILDMNVYSWGQRAQTVHSKQQAGMPLISLPTFLEHFLVFVNAYLMLNQENQLAVISSIIGESYFVYPPPPDQRASVANQVIAEQIQSRLKDIQDTYVDKIGELQGDETSASFSAAMSLGLCHINRMKKDLPNLKPRILVFNISPDVSSQYIPVMNCIFSAQKQSIPVDSCILSSDSTFLQQASHLTSGIYLKPQRQENLCQYLVSTFLIDSDSRRHLSVPTLTTVDFKASCFCHKRIVDIGFVCSVCLSIFCKPSSSCSTCGTKFALKIDLSKIDIANSLSTNDNNNNNNNNNNNSNNGSGSNGAG
ncbi:hypothetical protein SAMD00019534_117560 [Acytostelium subglobosum LB1]|uniref:hypothetical protein n=1 Tax=Acytostelium subglobosum LB1 TaxID=1410327 RepID=UPI000644EB22|nr:hypothetical protein SAMD00019534_117560 [Acytostelium subglobosum LB1]GAM28580.1 hypothetical protein SAMD00019534_117560 [Acytostelium subglobosum LB1]|eukprot:XP_012748358.1 hypothetical protein SAMD00019534_117560 [Acytostelium subglobosum LB1]